MLKRYLPGGATRQLWDDEQAARLRAAGLGPRRASRVFVIEEGPHRGKFAADFSPLGDDFRYCMGPFERYDETVAAEQAHVQEAWVLGRATT